MSDTPKSSFVERAQHARAALLVGCGGGGDIIQAIPLMNYLRRLGVRDVCLADVGIKWWGQYDGLDFGGEVLSLDWLEPSERLGRYAALVSPETRITGGNSQGMELHEAIVAREMGVPAATISLSGGLPGVREGLEALIEHIHAELFITVDIGADTFYTGEETTVWSPLVDAFMLQSAASMSIPSVFALSGYGCDAEIPRPILTRNVARAMQMGGYLGAYGLTQQDVADLGRVLAHFPGEQVEQWPYEAARGNLGTYYCKRFWAVDVDPLVAVDLFFDPGVIVEHINPLPRAIANTKTLAEAEEVILRFGLYPETRLPQFISLPTSPQIPDQEGSASQAGCS